MNKKEITCIVCPIGCKILVKTDGNNCEILDGNKCNQGISYAKSEALNPCRVITSSIFVKNGSWPLVSVKTTKPVPKEKIFKVLDEIKKAQIKAPVETGQILIKNVANTKIDIIATKSIKSQ